MGTVFLGVCTIEPPKTVPHLTSPLKGEEQNYNPCKSEPSVYCVSAAPEVSNKSGS